QCCTSLDALHALSAIRGKVSDRRSYLQHPAPTPYEAVRERGSAAARESPSLSVIPSRDRPRVRKFPFTSQDGGGSRSPQVHPEFPRVAGVSDHPVDIRHPLSDTPQPRGAAHRRAPRGCGAISVSLEGSGRTSSQPMPPISSPPGIAAPAGSGLSATTASVVRKSAAMEAAFCRAERVTLTGSLMPAARRSSYSPVAALRPSEP